MKYAFLISAAALLASVGLASAHVTVKPAQVGLAAFQAFAVSVPTEGDSATTKLRLVLPAGLKYVTPTVKPGWEISTIKEGDDVTEIIWSGGSIPAERRDDFGFSAQVPASATTLVWDAYQTLADGSVVSWNQEAGHDDEDATPHSKTAVVDDLTPVPTEAKRDAAAYGLSVVAIVLSIIAMVGVNRRK